MRHAAASPVALSLPLRPVRRVRRTRRKSTWRWRWRIDISGSIDPDEAKLQREGYVQAFRDPVIIKAILGGSHGRIAVAYYEWSDSWMQKLLIDWTLLDSARRRSQSFTTRLGQRADLDRAPHLDQRRHPLRHPAVRPQPLSRPSARCSTFRATARTTTAGW